MSGSRPVRPLRVPRWLALVAIPALGSACDCGPGHPDGGTDSGVDGGDDGGTDPCGPGCVQYVYPDGGKVFYPDGGPYCLC